MPLAQKKHYSYCTGTVLRRELLDAHASTPANFFGSGLLQRISSILNRFGPWVASNNIALQEKPYLINIAFEQAC